MHFLKWKVLYLIQSNWAEVCLEVMRSIPAGSTINYRFLCGFICVSLCQSIKIKPTNMYIASTRAQIKIKTHRCWNWHLCIPDGLSVVQCSLGHVIGIVFFTQFQWHEVDVLDNWQLVVLPQSGGCELDPRGVHDNLSVPLWVYMHFSVPEHQNQTNKNIYWISKLVHHCAHSPDLSWATCRLIVDDHVRFFSKCLGLFIIQNLFL